MLSCTDQYGSKPFPFKLGCHRRESLSLEIRKSGARWIKAYVVVTLAGVLVTITVLVLEGDVTVLGGSVEENTFVDVDVI